MSEFYQNPLNTRYASEEIRRIFSSDFKFSTWRKLWTALAESEKELGLDITDEQIAQMKENIDNIDFDLASQYEKELRHDVMAHIRTFGDQAPLAKPIIHLGATSAFVGDNTDIIQYKEGLVHVRKLLITLISNLAQFALEYKDTPTLGFTHFQAAQLTTVGKRAGLWLQDLMIDLEDLDYLLSTIKLRGTKGTTGTQASFMDLFENDEEKVKQLDILVAEKMGYDGSYDLTGQTYPRKFDSRVIYVLSSIAQTLSKFATDLRLLQHLKEIEEPFETNQVGSSAMAYKRNPMRSERICSLARYVITDTLNPALTMSSQWFERTLDDSANKRISIPEAFLAVDSILNIAINITQNLVVYEQVIQKHILEELPFMITENIIMEGVKNGGDRQELHEKIRQLSIEAGKNVKERGLENNLLELILNDPDNSFNLNEEQLQDLLRPENYTGRAGSQVYEYVTNVVNPMLEENQEFIINKDFDLKV